VEVKPNAVVTLHYSVRDAESSFSESSEGREPLVYLHGHGHIVPGLEKELRGKRAGDAFTVAVAAKDAYGTRDPEAVQRVPIKHLIRPGKLAVGQIVAVNTQSGAQQATVLKVGRFNVDLDLNHPLAGKDLVFDINVLDVREAAAEELAHGHVHGPGGAHG
jgi:FKBP-type peptidyl-prolyl cis-trans isomerase SlyD